MGGTSNTMSEAAPMDAAQSSPGMMGMMSAMKGKMGKMKMSMDEMKGMSGDKAMKSKMEGMESMMADMEGMMESMMGGMANDGGMMEMKKDGMGGMQMMGAMGERRFDEVRSTRLPRRVAPLSRRFDRVLTSITRNTSPSAPSRRRPSTEIAEKSRLDQAATDRQVAEANQTLFTLTGADEPDADKIDTEITEIENLAAERRRAFIRQVGEAAQLLTEDQRKILVGLPMPNDSAVSKSSASKPETSAATCRTCEPPTELPTRTIMNNHATSLLAIAIFAASILALAACSALPSDGTHEMGPSGRSQTMANGFMLEQSRGARGY